MGNAGHHGAQRGQLLLRHHLPLQLRKILVGPGVVQRNGAVGAQVAQHQLLALAIGLRARRLHGQHAEQAVGDHERCKEQAVHQARAGDLRHGCAVIGGPQKQHLALAGAAGGEALGVVERDWRVLEGLAFFHAQAELELGARAVKQVHGQAVHFEQRVHMPLQRFQNALGVQLGGNFLANGAQVLEGIVGVAQRRKALGLGGGQAAQVGRLSPHAFDLMVRVQGGGTALRFVTEMPLPRLASAAGEAIGLLKLALRGVGLRGGFQQVGAGLVAGQAVGAVQRFAEPSVRRFGMALGAFDFGQGSQHIHQDAALLLTPRHAQDVFQRLLGLAVAPQADEGTGAPQAGVTSQVRRFGHFHDERVKGDQRL